MLKLHIIRKFDQLSHMPDQIKYFGTLAYISLITLASCRHKTVIPLEKTQQTSEYLICDKVFSDTRKSIVEMNEILIQTGKIDTLEDTIAMGAVIRDQGHEVILNRIRAAHKGEHYTEQFAGKGYRLLLNYDEKTVYSSLNYIGTCELWIDDKHYEFDIEGTRNVL